MRIESFPTCHHFNQFMYGIAEKKTLKPTTTTIFATETFPAD